MFYPFSRIMMAWLFTFTTTFSTFTSAAQAKHEKESSQVLLKIALETTKSPEHSILYLAAAGASAELIRDLRKTYQENFAKVTAFPKLTLASGKILADGKPTGVSVTSYSPLNLEYNGQVWNFDRSKTVDENFYSLRKFFQGKKSASLLRFFVNEAEAQELTTAQKIGVGLGALVAAALVGPVIGIATATGATAALVATTIVYVISSIAIAAVGTGYLFGSLFDQVMASLDPKSAVLNCTPQSITIKYADGSKVEISNSAVVVTDKANKSTSPVSKEDAKALLESLNCKDEKGADILKEKLVKTSNEVREKAQSQAAAGVPQGKDAPKVAPATGKK